MVVPAPTFRRDCSTDILPLLAPIMRTLFEKVGHGTSLQNILNNCLR